VAIYIFTRSVLSGYKTNIKSFYYMKRNTGCSKTHLLMGKGARPERIIDAVLRKIFPDTNTPVLIAIGGPGGSGKTTFAEKLAVLLGDAGIVSLDNYKISRKLRLVQDTWGPHPAANKMELIIEHLEILRSGSCIHIPQYNQDTGDALETREYLPVRFNLIEGEISTYDQFQKYIDFSIYIDSDFNTQLSTRLGRDMQLRGHSYEKAITNFLKSNLQEFIKYGIDSKTSADVHIFCHADYQLEIEAVRSDILKEFQDVATRLKPIAIEGLIVPLTTPFNRDGTLCRKAFVDHLKWLSQYGVSRILVSGTTGEFFSMTSEERLQMLGIAREFFQGLVMFQTGAASLPDTLDLMKKAIRYGADAIMALSPYYFSNAPEDGIVKYLNSLSSQCSVPFVLYNFPKHTGNPLTPAIANRVSHFGLKDSTGESDLISSTPCFLAGSSTKIVQAHRLGAKGFVSAMANVYPELFVGIEHAIVCKDFSEAERLQVQAVQKKEDFIGKYEIVVLKKLLSEKISGFPEYVRPPL
jgi:4-hydroxy-tetrahydrodipicolinate synthase